MGEAGGVWGGGRSVSAPRTLVRAARCGIRVCCWRARGGAVPLPFPRSPPPPAALCTIRPHARARIVRAPARSDTPAPAARAHSRAHTQRHTHTHARTHTRPRARAPTRPAAGALPSWSTPAGPAPPARPPGTAPRGWGRARSPRGGERASARQAGPGPPPPAPPPDGERSVPRHVPVSLLPNVPPCLSGRYFCFLCVFSPRPGAGAAAGPGRRRPAGRGML